jgi:hypothetical protein
MKPASLLSAPEPITCSPATDGQATTEYGRRVNHRDLRQSTFQPYALPTTLLNPTTRTYFYLQYFLLPLLLTTKIHTPIPTKILNDHCLEAEYLLE